MTEEFKQGMLAWFCGSASSDNPYIDEPSEAEWRNGLFAASDAYYLGEADNQEIADYFTELSKLWPDVL